MSVDRFIDTNVFIYYLENTDQRKAAIARQLIDDGLSRQHTCISFQVVQECLNSVIRKAEIRLNHTGCTRFLDTVLAPLWQVMPSVQLYGAALSLQSRYGYSFYDSLIIAAAREAGCRRLLTEDMQHGQRIGDLVIENPFYGT